MADSFLTFLDSFDNVMDALEALRTNSPAKVGEGYFAEVWEHPDEPFRVIKFSESDACFEQYTESLPDNPHFPRVYDVLEMMGGTFFEMEYLEPMTPAAFGSLDLDSQMAFAYLMLMTDDNGVNLDRFFHDYPVQEVRDRIEEEIGVDILEPPDPARVNPALWVQTLEDMLRDSCDRAICEAAQAIFDYAADARCDLDMHVDNAMVRDDGTLVFTDPWAG